MGYGILKLVWILTLMLNMWIWGFNFGLSWDRSGLWETLDCPGPWQQPGSTIILGSGQQDWYLMIIRSSYAALPHPTTAQTQRSRNPWKRSRHDCCQDGGGTHVHVAPAPARNWPRVLYCRVRQITQSEPLVVCRSNYFCMCRLEINLLFYILCWY